MHNKKSEKKENILSNINALPKIPKITSFSNPTNSYTDNKIKPTISPKLDSGVILYMNKMMKSNNQSIHPTNRTKIENMVTSNDIDDEANQGQINYEQSMEHNSYDSDEGLKPRQEIPQPSNLPLKLSVTNRTIYSTKISKPELKVKAKQSKSLFIKAEKSINSPQTDKSNRVNKELGKFYAVLIEKKREQNLLEQRIMKDKIENSLSLNKYNVNNKENKSPNQKTRNVDPIKRDQTTSFMNNYDDIHFNIQENTNFQDNNIHIRSRVGQIKKQNLLVVVNDNDMISQTSVIQKNKDYGQPNKQLGIKSFLSIFELKIDEIERILNLKKKSSLEAEYFDFIEGLIKRSPVSIIDYNKNIDVHQINKENIINLINIKKLECFRMIRCNQLFCIIDSIKYPN